MQSGKEAMEELKYVLVARYEMPIGQGRVVDISGAEAKTEMELERQARALG